MQLLPYAIKGGLALGGSLLASKLSKSKPTELESNVLSQDANTAKTSAQTGANVLNMGANATQPVLNYWASILSGNRAATTSALAPEISRIGEGYRTASNTSAALNPRGGPSASFLSEVPYQQQRDVSTLLQSARPAAAQSLGTMGNNLLSNGTNLLYASTAAGRNILEQQRQQKLLEAERGKSIGTGLFDLIQKYGFPAIDNIFKGRGGDTPADTGISTGTARA